jgi:hypothetical protein
VLPSVTLPPLVERLSDKQYVVLLLRLLVDNQGQIVYGDAGGPTQDEPSREEWVHFRGPEGLLDAVLQWLASHQDQYRA